jgi:tRNA nucleotidyltransferase/poly(A) polymerase
MKLRELLSEIKDVQVQIGTSVPYICGGTPRDKYLNNIANMADLDITTGDKSVDYLSQELYNTLSKKYNVLRKTMDDGHSSIHIGKFKIDFSSNYITPDIDNFLKLQGIESPTNMQREIFSRDFTCNALLMTVDLSKIIDITNRGFQDIKERKIKTCLPPEVTLVSNKNRVIRSIYLACKLNFDIDESIIEFVKNNPESVKISSPKSLSEKLNLAFEKDADKASYLLTKMNLWNYVPITEVVYPYYMKHVKGASNAAQ